MRLLAQSRIRGGVDVCRARTRRLHKRGREDNLRQQRKGIKSSHNSAVSAGILCHVKRLVRILDEINLVLDIKFGV